MPRALLCVLLSFVVLLGPGCGTLFGLFLPRGVQVASTPAGATISVDGEVHEETTPTKIGIWSGKDHVVEAVYFDEHGNELKGTTTVGRRVRLWLIFANIVTSAGLGIFVDWLTGALLKFEKDKVWINMGDHQAVADEVHQTPPDPVAEPPRPRIGPRPTPQPAGDATSSCIICGEPRSDRVPCPSCGAN
jgi:hypothetical protein